MGTQLNYTLQNIRNIDNASITIKPLTIIAGENSSGKTFVTKSLYTVLDSVYKNHLLDSIITHFRNLEDTFLYLQESINNPSQKDETFFTYSQEFLNEIKQFIFEVKTSPFKQEEKIVSQYVKLFNEYQSETEEYFTQRLKTKKFQKYKSIIKATLDYIRNFLNTITYRVDTVAEGIASSLEVGLKKNFQITNLQHLINQNHSKSLKLSLSNLGEIKIDKKQEIKFDLKADGISQVQSVENIIFFDSPVYIKIRKALESSKHGRFYKFDKDEDKYLKGYPQYLEQLYDFIDKEYIDIADFDKISQEIQAKIKGKLEVSKSGDINYTDDNNHTIPLSLTAMGIVNIGLIDLLLRNNIINKGSFLIMDEPEVHLHPQWQVFLAQILYKIAKNGANIIIATHSLDFLKAFENILKSELEKVGIVLDDLSKPFYDLYMQDI